MMLVFIFFIFCRDSHWRRSALVHGIASLWSLFFSFPLPDDSATLAAIENRAFDTFSPVLVLVSAKSAPTLSANAFLQLKKNKTKRRIFMIDLWKHGEAGGGWGMGDKG